MKEDSPFIYNHMLEDKNETDNTFRKNGLGSFQFIVEELLILATLFIMIAML